MCVHNHTEDSGAEFVLALRSERNFGSDSHKVTQILTKLLSASEVIAKMLPFSTQPTLGVSSFPFSLKLDQPLDGLWPGGWVKATTCVSEPRPQETLPASALSLSDPCLPHEREAGWGMSDHVEHWGASPLVPARSPQRPAN